MRSQPAWYLARYVDEAHGGEEAIILRDGKPIAALVPLEMVEAFDKAEDELLAREAIRRLDERSERVTMARVIADIFGEKQ
ncbi:MULTISPECIES: type II toxin-antitoxin system Phd/YefM family antitoxin [unclassified Nocardia]|uniref:type II toxin-antitoxin system Phd/YefM family antitoxin n=1 Tax=unclassified Nocardia TaxID=2637762 RepID=UPI003868EF82|nr:type II toxin-antitoxin system Phd/YefM family antitoxin [Nocardia sp. NBC_00881]